MTVRESSSCSLFHELGVAVLNEDEAQRQVIDKFSKEITHINRPHDSELQAKLAEEQNYKKLADFLDDEYRERLLESKGKGVIMTNLRLKRLLESTNRSYEKHLRVDDMLRKGGFLQSKVFKSDELAIKRCILQELMIETSFSLGVEEGEIFEGQPIEQVHERKKLITEEIKPFEPKKRKRTIFKFKEDVVNMRKNPMLKLKGKSYDSMVDDKDTNIFEERLREALVRKLWWDEQIKNCNDEVQNILHSEPESLELPERVQEMESDEIFQELVDGINVFKDKNLSLPLSLKYKLYDHQKEGVQWLWNLRKKESGGILGDEQGLGKTCQISTFLGLLKLLKYKKQDLNQYFYAKLTKPRSKKQEIFQGEQYEPVDPFSKKTNHRKQKRLRAIHSQELRKVSDFVSEKHLYCLIVCPTTTINLWLQELKNWAPWLRVHVMHSSSSNFESVMSLLRRARRLGDIVLTSYGTLRLDDTKKLIFSKSILRLGSFDCIVLDEGHKLKNPLTESSEIVRNLRCKQKIIVTGTPLQNGLNELWTLFDIIRPGLLGTYSMFEKQFERVIKQGGNKNASKGMAYMAYRCAMILKKTIAPYMLRRTKKQLLALDSEQGLGLKLPKKSEHVLFCRLTEYQVKLYEDFLGTPELENFLSRKASIGNTFGKVGKRKPIAFRFIRPLQHICNHPHLFFQYQEDLDSLPVKLSNNKLTAAGPEDLVQMSGKLKVLLQLLINWKASKTNNKVLVFSQSRGMLDILERIVQHRQYSYLRMDGKTNIRQRQQLIDEFNSDEDIFVFLLTTKVGGVGINLTGANKVVIYDPDWNPTTDSQARERAYRLGQRRDVKVLRFIAAGTIEEKVYERQIFKQYLTNKVLEDPRQKGISTISKGKGMRNLFTLSGYEHSGLEDENVETEEIISNTPKKNIDGVTEVFRSFVNFNKVSKIDFQNPENKALKQEADKMAANAMSKLNKSARHQMGGSASAQLLKNLS